LLYITIQFDKIIPIQFYIDIWTYVVIVQWCYIKFL